MRKLRIGQLAKAAQVHVQTVRYYERRGLLPDPVRQASGYRLYSQEDVKQLRFIKRAQELGFSLREIKDLLTLRVDSSAVCSDVQRRATVKVQDIEQRIAALQQIKRALIELMSHCAADTVSQECIFLEILDSDDELFTNHAKENHEHATIQ